MHMGETQGCGLGIDVTVSRRNFKRLILVEMLKVLVSTWTCNRMSRSTFNTVQPNRKWSVQDGGSSKVVRFQQ